jgi:hypothetical protein
VFRDDSLADETVGSVAFSSSTIEDGLTRLDVNLISQSPIDVERLVITKRDVSRDCCNQSKEFSSSNLSADLLIHLNRANFFFTNNHTVYITKTDTDIDIHLRSFRLERAGQDLCQGEQLLIRFSRFFPFFGSQKKLDPGKSIELSRNYIQISDGTGSKQGCFLENRRGLFSL